MDPSHNIMILTPIEVLCENNWRRMFFLSTSIFQKSVNTVDDHCNSATPQFGYVNRKPKEQLRRPWRYQGWRLARDVQHFRVSELIRDAVCRIWSILTGFPYLFISFSGTGHIFTDDLGAILRGLGFNVTEHEVSDLVNAYDKEGSGRLQFDALYYIIRDNGPFPRVLSPDEVIDRFRIFDIHNCGKLHSAKLVEILCNMGEGISRDDAEQLMREVEVDGDSMVDIEAFVRYMQASSIDWTLWGISVFRFVDGRSVVEKNELHRPPAPEASSPRSPGPMELHCFTRTASVSYPIPILHQPDFCVPCYQICSSNQELLEHSCCKRCIAPVSRTRSSLWLIKSATSHENINIESNAFPLPRIFFGGTL